MKVLVIRNAYQQDAGGAEQYALNLCQALKKAGHRPILVTKVRTILAKAKLQKIKTIKAKWYDHQGWYRGYYLRYPLTVLWYMWVILSRGIDVVHAQSRDDFVFATKAARLLRKKVIWTDHADLKHVLDNERHFNPRMRAWIIKAATKVAAIICVSSSEVEAVKKVAPDLPVPVLVHNGVFLPEDIKPIAKNNFVIGTNARLVADKGIQELITAFAQLKNFDAELWLLGGESGNKNKYEKLSRELGVVNQVKILGYVNEPNNYVAAMDIFVHASYHEGLSLAIVEAAMLSRPIIATRVGGTPEILDESSAILIEPRNSEAIAKALKRFIDDEGLRNKLGRAANAKVRKEFDFQKIVEGQIIPLYEE
jgi:glycosyltransferase involved in cell wall biosynthesis